MTVLLRLLVAALISSFGWVGVSLASQGETKVALVIGNGAYKNAPDLPNPPNDARAMASLLRSLDFDVVEGVDLDKDGMIDAIDEFTEKAYEADVGLIFYAGHGMQVEGKNYIIPVDAELTRAAHLRTRTIEIEDVVAALPPDPNIGIVILDACRDNPLARTLARGLPATRSATMGDGLAAVQVESQGDGTGGTLIAYATDPGAVALDGENTTNSPYTQALIKHFSTPGIELQAALTRVRGDVARETEGRQRPWHNASLGREVFLGGKLQVPAPVAVAPQAQQGTEVAALSPAATDLAAPSQPVVSAAGNAATWEIERRFWDEATKRNTIGHYEAYLAEYPGGKFATIAALNIKQLKAKDSRVAAANAVNPDPEAALVVAATNPTVQTRTTFEITEEMRTTPGTVVSEEAIGMTRNDRRDLQRRLNALGHSAGGADGKLGPKSRRAIGAWQSTNGIIETQMLTSDQWAALKAQSEPKMAEIRRQEAAAAAARKKQRATASRTTTRSTKKAYRKPSGSRNNYRGKRRSGNGKAFVGGAILGAGAAIVTCKAIGAC